MYVYHWLPLPAAALSTVPFHTQRPWFLIGQWVSGSVSAHAPLLNPDYFLVLFTLACFHDTAIAIAVLTLLFCRAR